MEKRSNLTIASTISIEVTVVSITTGHAIIISGVGVSSPIAVVISDIFVSINSSILVTSVTISTSVAYTLTKHKSERWSFWWLRYELKILLCNWKKMSTTIKRVKVGIWIQSSQTSTV